MLPTTVSAELARVAKDMTKAIQVGKATPEQARRILESPVLVGLPRQLEGLARQLGFYAEAFQVEAIEAEAQANTDPVVTTLEQLEELYDGDEDERGRWEAIVKAHGHDYDDDARCLYCGLPAEVAGAQELVSLLCAGRLWAEREAAEKARAEELAKGHELRIVTGSSDGTPKVTPELE